MRPVLSASVRALVAALAVALVGGACGDLDHGETGVCAGRPCLTWIDNLADWTVVSAPHLPDGRCDFLEDAKFLAPATADAALQAIVFQDVGVHRLHLDFMTQALPEYFGGLAPETYRQIVQRRATRQYWAGVLFRLVDARGATTGYGFDVVTERTYDERPTEAEVQVIASQLATRFRLPLVYAPVDGDAIAAAGNFEAEVHLPRACEQIACATAGVDCIEVPTGFALCATFQEGRDAETELAAKARVTVTATSVDLPRAPGRYEVPAIFGAGEVGAARVALIPDGTTARYAVEDQGGFRLRGYHQRFTLAGAPYEVSLAVRVADGGGGLRLDPFTATASYLASLRASASTTSTWLSSCTAAADEPWQIRGELGGGDRFAIDYRYRDTGFASRPVFVTRGTVTLDGVTAVVDDYFRLVYAGEHHNWNNQFWVLFADPISYRGHPVSGVWLDLAAASWDLDAAYTLDAERQPLDVLTVTGYVVERLR